MTVIFICYRNIHRSWAPMAIDHALRVRFGAEAVFEAGRVNVPAVEFDQNIERALRECTLLLALIDPPWVGADLPKLFEPRDWVRREIAYALSHGKTVLPLLLDGAEMPRAAVLPPEIAGLTRRIGLRLRSQDAADGMVRLIGEVERLAPAAVLNGLTDQALPPTDDPAHLLRAERGILPFRDRAEFDDTTRWYDDPRGVPVRLITGGPGIGKTRLALRLTAWVRERRRPAGLLSAWAPPEALHRLGRITTPHLVVIDDADTRPQQVAVALRSLAGEGHPSARLLLLARSSGEWLDRLREDPDDATAALAGRLVPVPLAPIRPVPEDFDIACAALAGPLKISPVPTAPTRSRRFQTLLEVQAAALAHLLGPGHPSTDAPLRRVLELERGHWRRVATVAGLPAPDDQQLRELMAAVTLFAAETEEEADRLVAALRVGQGQPATVVDAWRHVLRAVLPGPAALNPMHPEQLGEEAIIALLDGRHRLDRLVELATDGQAIRALIGLGRCLERRPVLGAELTRWFGDAPDRLLPCAIVAVRSLADPEPLVAAMAAALGNVAETALSAVVDALPQRSEALAGFAVDAVERALATRRNAGEEGMAIARLARGFAVRLCYLGRRPEDAVAAARFAVDQLTAEAARSVDPVGTGRAGEVARPGGPAPRGTGPAAAVLPAELAEAHATLALALDLAGAEALSAGERAVAAYRVLPEDDRYRGGLATALHNQSIRQRRAGDRAGALDAALEAYRLTGPLHDIRPARYRSLHADVQDNLAILRALSGQPGEAERLSRDTLRLRRELAEARPDAYRPQLAGTLHNLALILSTTDAPRSEVRALLREAATHYEQLAARWPGRFDDKLGHVRGQLAAENGDVDG